jgi:hypothetical protein
MCTVAIVTVASSWAIACTAILGITDVPVPDDGGTGRRDASASSSDAAADGPCGTEDDTHNCGHCGHDCLGGKCSKGACQPVFLIDTDAGVSPAYLAQDDEFLYWTDIPNETVNRTSKSSGKTKVEQQSGGARAIAVDDAALYWGDYIGVWRCSKTACFAGEKPTLIANASDVASLAIDDQGIYWSENGLQILAAHKYGSSETGSVLWQGDASTEFVATDGQRVYFTADDGVLHGVGVDGGESVTTGDADGDASSFGIALNGGVVYWTVSDVNHGVISETPTKSLGSSTLATAQREPIAVASDGNNVYWINAGNGAPNGAEIVECSILPQCSPTVIARGFSPLAIVVDDVAVYWTDTQTATGNNGTLSKLAK